MSVNIRKSTWQTKARYWVWRKEEKMSIFNDNTFSSVYLLFFIQLLYTLKNQFTDHSWLNFNEYIYSSVWYYINVFLTPTYVDCTLSCVLYIIFNVYVSMKVTECNNDLTCRRFRDKGWIIYFKLFNKTRIYSFEPPQLEGPSYGVPRILRLFTGLSIWTLYCIRRSPIWAIFHFVCSLKGPQYETLYYQHSGLAWFCMCSTVLYIEDPPWGLFIR